MPPNSPPPVLVDRVQKRFEIPRDQVSTLKERALHPLRRRGETDTLHALRGDLFAVEPGEFFGIVGRNGSGKSTLLKCLAGIYSVDSGRIYIDGRMSTFIELGVGFNPDLPARDNALLNATMLGLSPREARRRFDSVIDFAELGDFVEMKIKDYSSGMLVRLAFAVMIHVDAEILLIDEVLAVGDASFQQKCYDEFERIRDSGSTVLFVTHDMSAVQRFCDRALLLEHGRPVVMGDPEHVGNRYLELNFSEQARQVEEAAARPKATVRRGARRGADGEPDVVDASQRRTEPAVIRYGDGARRSEAWFEDSAGRGAETLHRGQPCTFGARVRFNGEVENPLFGINVQNNRRDHLLSASNLLSEPHCGTFRQARKYLPDQLRERARTRPILVTPAVAHHGGAWIDRRERMISVVVTGARLRRAARPALRDVIERGAADRRRAAGAMSRATDGDQPRRLA